MANQRILVIYTALATLVERDIRIEDVLDLGEKFNDVLFVSRNTASLVERCTVNTNDILVLGERIHDSLVAGRSNLRLGSVNSFDNSKFRQHDATKVRIECCVITTLDFVFRATLSKLLNRIQHKIIDRSNASLLSEIGKSLNSLCTLLACCIGFDG